MPDVIIRGDVWYVRYGDETGKRVRKRTSAQTKREAMALAHELAADAERRRMGLAPKRLGVTMTLGELCTWWLDNRCPPRSAKLERQRLKLRVISTQVGELPLIQVTAARLETHFRALEKSGELGPNSINHLRAILRAIFNKARKAELWQGANPAADTEPRKVPKRVYETLSIEEVPRVLALVQSSWRGFVAAAVYQGLRKGECAGLRKVDVDLARDLITIRASYDDDTTKGKHAEVVPLAPLLRPYVEVGMRSVGPYLFPDPKGEMRPPDSNPERILRTALSAAGVVLGYEHTCRRCTRKKTPHSEQHPDPAPRKCPRCGFRLWPRPLPRKVRFHDLRHSTATILLRAGVDAHRVQRIMRHASITTTTGTYAHLMAEDSGAPSTRSLPSSLWARSPFWRPPRWRSARVGPNWVQADKKGPTPCLQGRANHLHLLLFLV